MQIKILQVSGMSHDFKFCFQIKKKLIQMLCEQSKLRQNFLATKNPADLFDLHNLRSSGPSD